MSRARSNFEGLQAACTIKGALSKLFVTDKAQGEVPRENGILKSSSLRTHPWLLVHFPYRCPVAQVISIFTQSESSSL